ncbi:MAG: cytochrome c oxidase subunit 3 [Verrucomicrobiota bacterium]
MDIPYTVAPRQDTGLYNAKVGIWLFLASEVMLFGALFSSYILLRVGAEPGMWPHGLLNIPIGTFNTAVLITSSVTVVLSWAALKTHNFGRFRAIQSITLLCALGFLGIKTYEYNEKFTHYEVWFADGRPSVTGHIDGAGRFWTLNTLADKKIESITMHPDRFHYRIPSGEQAKLAKSGTVPEHPEPIKIATSEIKRLSAFVPAHSTYFAVYFTLTFLHALHVFGGALVIGYLWGPGASMWKTDPDRFTNRIEVSGLFWHFVDLVWIFLFPVLYLL